MTHDGSLTRINAAITPQGLMLMGVLPDPDDTRRSIALVGTDAGFWQVFTDSPEYHDEKRDPIDRWSKRILGALATALGAQAAYPSDGPPYAPFIAWAKATGRFWSSPTGMLIHDRAGLMVSIRGALVLAQPCEPDVPTQNPCAICTTRPCVSACPVDALSDRHNYGVHACKDHLVTPEGQSSCMQHGCLVRTICPVSKSFNRRDAQSAFHMLAFKGA